MQVEILPGSNDSSEVDIVPELVSRYLNNFCVLSLKKHCGVVTGREA
jgi:hypothetical protein